MHTAPGKFFYSITSDHRGPTCTAPSLKPNVYHTHDIILSCLPTAAKGLAVFPVPTLLAHEPMNATDFFSDTPWGNVPPHRLGDITILPQYPRGGLLGGSSKLAALAAARKKKQEAAKMSSEGSSQSVEAQSETDKAISLLDRLKATSFQNENHYSANIPHGRRRPLLSQ